MLATEDKHLADRARYFSTTARQNYLHYEHTAIGYNYRMSNILAAIGLGQLEQLEEKVVQRRNNFITYKSLLSDVEGLHWSEEGADQYHSRWLTTVLINEAQFGASRDKIIEALEARNIESRPLWKPMHLQPVFENREYVGNTISEDLFTTGICLPSGEDLSSEQQSLIIDKIKYILDETNL